MWTARPYQKIPKALNVSSNDTAAVVTHQDIIIQITSHKLAQFVEMEAAVIALVKFKEQQMNLFTDSNYITQVNPKLELAGPIAPHKLI